jgi:hypothetical protein
MRTAVLFLLSFGVASAVPAQSIIPGSVTIPTSQCVYRSGDDPAWAAPSIDDSAWKPNPHWQGLPDQAHIWVRCHADLSSIQAEAHPAIQITLYAAYQLFLDGRAIGGAGDVRTGTFSMNVIRQYPLASYMLHSQPSTIALRIAYRVNGQSPVTGAPNMGPPIIHAGDSRALNAQRADVVLTDSSKLMVSAFVYSLVGVLGLTLLGLFYYDRSRLDLLYLSMLCQALALFRVNEFCMAYQMNYSSTLRIALATVGIFLVPLMSALFFFALVHRRVPLFYWLPIAIIFVRCSVNGISLFLPVDQALWLFGLTFHLDRSPGLWDISSVAISTAPFVAFWPYTRIARRLRPLVALCLLLGVSDLAWFVTALTNNLVLGLPNFSSWRFELLEIRSLATAGILIALLVLLSRDQRQVTEERALLAGEMQAAQEIQRALVPASLETMPGLKIAAAFRPVRDVGGDFYSCRILPGDRQRILLGDVSGKGVAAAMTAAGLIGAAQRHESESPAQLLRHLNLVMADMNVSGFATCLCAEISADGKLTLTNAGHLAPYLNGNEMDLHSGLPLGVSRDEEYTENTIQLSPGDVLTLLSDGVVEAQSTSGELFGFDRTRLLSSKPADQIAHAAQSFGQEDDITVLTLSFAPAETEVVHA